MQTMNLQRTVPRNAGAFRMPVRSRRAVVMVKANQIQVKHYVMSPTPVTTHLNCSLPLSMRGPLRAPHLAQPCTG